MNPGPLISRSRRFMLAAIGLLLLVLNRPQAAPCSPFWRETRWGTADLHAEAPGLHRLRLRGGERPNGTEGADVQFWSGARRCEFRKSTRALREEPGHAFALSAKSVWFRDESVSANARGDDRRFVLRAHLAPGWVGRSLDWAGLILLALAILLRRWRMAWPADGLPPAPVPRGSRIDQVVALVLTWLLILPAGVLAVGYALSALSLLGSPAAWALGGAVLAVALALGAILLKFLGPQRQWGIAPGALRALVREIGREFAAAPLRGSLALTLFGALMVVQVAQVGIAALLAPTNYDSLTYILPRLACFLQRSSLDHFDGNYVAMTVHFKNATLLQVFAFLATGRMENATQFVALGASWVALIGIFGTSHLLTGRVLPSMAAASVAGLTTNFMMIAVTPQLDMPVTGAMAASLYFLVRWIQAPERIFSPFLAAIACSLGLGCKASALLLLPSLGVVALAGPGLPGWRRLGSHARAWLPLAAGGLTGLLMFVLPAGYAENIRRYGHFMGPEGWRSEHVAQRGATGDFLTEGARNAARYAVHFAGLDGLPFSEATVRIQNGLRAPLLGMARLAGMDLAEKGSARQPFSPELFWTPNEDLSFAGPALLLLLIPGALAAHRRLGPHRRLVAVLVGGGALFFLAQSFLSRYDPWRGRSFAALVIWMGPLAGALFCSASSESRPWARISGEILLALACLVAALCGLNAGFFRHSSPLYSQPGTITFQGSILGQRDRLWQVFRANPEFLDRHRRLQAALPRRADLAVAAAPVAQYPIFGEKLERRVTYVPEGEPAPEGVHVLYAEGRLPFRDGDVALDVLETVPDGRARQFLRKP